MSRRTAPQGDEQLDFFSACYADIPIRDQRDTMERPFFSLAKKPRRTPIEYQVGDVFVRVSPNKDHGIATIWDADILIWAATQITEARDRGEKTSPKIRFHPHNLLKGIRRNTGGDQYEKLKDALRRLNATYVETNIRSPKSRKKDQGGFTWITTWGSHEEEGKPLAMTFTIADWLYQGIMEGGLILSIHEDYFLLTGGLERWLYRVARKHAGAQETGWQFTMRQLYEKSGSAARFSDFAIDIRKIVHADKLPEYALELRRNGEGEEIAQMIRRSHLAIDDHRYELPRIRRRRHAQGINAKVLTFAPRAE
jgi:plasmid replication initiation protein